jgi:hypothetical protein
MPGSTKTLLRAQVAGIKNDMIQAQRFDSLRFMSIENVPSLAPT